MNDLINLTKDVGIVLTKRKIDIVQCQVALNIDVSGSMTPVFNNGVMREVLSRIFALAWVFDDNKQLEAWAFSTELYELPTVTEQNVDAYVTQNIINNSKISWGGTRYTPAIQDTVNYFFSDNNSKHEKDNRNFIEKLFFKAPKGVQQQSEGSQDPVFLLFITDGMPDDKDQFIHYINTIKNKNIFIQAIGIGSTSFTVLDEIKNKTDNFSFYQVNDISNIPTIELYETIINEKFITWYKKQLHVAKK
jgi:hypothetical protein